jgi:hypothetical protein
MFCIASFVVLSILGIFSASNRALAREALDCVLRRVTSDRATPVSIRR